MRIWLLGSGSRGNATLIESGETRVLLDAGFGPRTLAKRLAVTGVKPQSVSALVITHEHTDHVSGARAAATRYGWSLYASRGTAQASRSLSTVPLVRFEAGATLCVGELELRTIPTSHDAAEPIAIVATSTRDGARVGIAYDVGEITEPLRAAFVDLDLLVLEANHDEDMLRAGPYPPFLQARIAGRTGHLSNRASAAMAASCVHRGLRHIVLAHLSEKCNTPRAALRAIGGAVARRRFRGQLHAARQDDVVGPFCSGTRAAAPAQLALPF